MKSVPPRRSGWVDAWTFVIGSLDSGDRPTRYREVVLTSWDHSCKSSTLQTASVPGLRIVCGGV